MPALDQINQGGTIYEIVPEIAELFKTTKAYHTGDHVIYEAGWYTFKADKSAGAWDATKVDGPFKVTDQLSDLKEDLNSKITNPSDGEEGQILTNDGQGGAVWSPVGLPTDEQTAEAVTAWLDEHPEATTTVEDHSLTADKLVVGTLGFITAEMYGAKGDGVTDDSDALEDALRSGFPVRLNAGSTYIITDLTVPHGFVLYGNGATLKRPNLKNAPYNRTDNQIKAERMLHFSSTNLGQQTIIRDVVFDGNAFSMWQPSDEYKYEQAPLIAVSGTSTTQAKIYIENCTFKDNYASGVSLQSYVDMKFINNFVSNCFKTAVTFVGKGSNLIVENLTHKNTVSYKNFFGPIHTEINSSDFANDAQSTYTVRGIKGEVGIIAGAMTGKGASVVQDVNIQNIGTTNDNGSPIVIVNASNSKVSVDNCVFAFAENAVSCVKFNGTGNFDLEITDTLFDGTLAPDSFVSFSPNDNAVGVVRFTNCTFKGLKYGVWIARNDNTHDITMIFDKCRFVDISNQAVGSGDVSALHLKAITFTNCTFNIGSTAYIFKQDGSQSNLPVLRFSGNRIIGANAGLRLYGLSADTLVFDNEVWDDGLGVSYYRSSRAPRVFGMRYRFATEAPTGIAFNDHDTAYVIDENGAITETYLYHGNAWVLQS